MAEPQRPAAKVLFRVPSEDGGTEVETLWAYDLGTDQYRIDNCPFFAYGVSLGDVVSAPFDPQEQFPTFQKVLSKSGNRTIRLILDPPLAVGNESEKVLTRLEELGCGYEGANKRYIAVNIPPSSDLAVVSAFLTELGIRWEHGDPPVDDVQPQTRHQP